MGVRKKPITLRRNNSQNGCAQLIESYLFDCGADMDEKRT